MTNFTFNSTDDLKIFLKDNKFNKILIISGDTSYKLSGADKIINELLINKNIKYFFKKFAYPDLL